MLKDEASIKNFDRLVNKVTNGKLRGGSILRLPVYAWKKWHLPLEKAYISKGNKAYWDEWKHAAPNVEVVSKAAIASDIGDANAEMNKLLARKVVEHLPKKKEPLVIYDVGVGKGDTSAKFLGELFSHKHVPVTLYLFDVSNKQGLEGVAKDIKKKFDVDVKTFAEEEGDMLMLPNVQRAYTLPPADVVLGNASLHHTNTYPLTQIREVLNEKGLLGIGEWTHPIWENPELSYVFLGLLSLQYQTRALEEVLKLAKDLMITNEEKFDLSLMTYFLQPPTVTDPEALEAFKRITNMFEVIISSSYKDFSQKAFISAINHRLSELAADELEAISAYKITEFWLQTLRFALESGAESGIWFWEGHPSRARLRSMLFEHGFNVLVDTTIYEHDEKRRSNLNTIIVAEKL